jgi:hypothetical protein
MNHQPMNPSTIKGGLSTADMKENFVSFVIFIIIALIIVVLIIYIIYLTRLNTSECNTMTSLYGKMDSHLTSINPSDPDCSGNLFDYYIKTAYSCCSGGSYRNDFVNICNLKNVLKQGARCLDFEIFSINNQPVVSSSTSDDVYIKETFNYVNFSDVMKTINSNAFSSGTAPNYNDPLIIHLRFQSNIQKMYSNMADVLQKYDSILLGSEYSFENNNQNLGNTPLVDFMGKVIIIVDRSNTSFMENQDFLEYVNLTSNSVFMRAYDYYGVKNNPDINELTDFNRTGMTIVFPDNDTNPGNPSGYLTRECGCQMTAMRFQYVDNYLEESTGFFDKAGYAFCLKPAYLRYQPITIPVPTPQNPANSYQTRNVGTDYYNFNF